MTVSRYFKIISILLATQVGLSMAAKAVSGKVRSRIGDVTIQKNGQGDWNLLRVDAKVYQGDFIRTLIESQAVIALHDGSTISVEENSLVALSELMTEDGANHTTADIKNGKVRFDVQKQEDKKSSFKFKTGTAVAAIRGTDGVVADLLGKGFAASLHSGALDLVINNQNYSIKSGQTIIQQGEKVSIYDLGSSGDLELIKQIENVIKDTTIQDLSDSIVQSIDLSIEKQKEELKNSLNCTFGAVPDSILDPILNIQAKCTEGFTIEIAGEKFVSEGQDIQFAPNWAPSSYGEKKFLVLVSKGDVKIPLTTISTRYVGKPVQADTIVVDSSTLQVPLSLTVENPITVCKTGSALIEGNFNPNDPNATLFIKFGNYRSPNLVPRSANGHFSHTIEISDRQNNVNIDKAEIEYSSALFKNEKIIVDVNVDMSCKNVNLTRPMVTFVRADSIACEAQVNLKDTKNDLYTFSYDIDGEPSMEKNFSDEVLHSVKLTTGVHKYTFNVVDQAGNSSQIQKTLGCYPRKNIGISFAKGTYEKLRIPPPPRGVDDVVYKVVNFKLTGLPQNNLDLVKRIIIRQNGKIVSDMSSSNFLSNNFDHQLTLTRKKTTKVTVEVTMMNGQVITATKQYEVH